jgi:hypothetical protein
MRMSITITSGRSSRPIATASRPSAASPTTAMSGCVEKITSISVCPSRCRSRTVVGCPAVLDRAQPGSRTCRLCVEQELCRVGLDHHRGHVVGVDVARIACDPRPFGGGAHRPLPTRSPPLSGSAPTSPRSVVVRAGGPQWPARRGSRRGCGRTPGPRLPSQYGSASRRPARVPGPVRPVSVAPLGRGPFTGARARSCLVRRSGRRRATSASRRWSRRS